MDAITLNSRKFMRVLIIIGVAMAILHAAVLYFRFFTTHDYIFGFIPKFDMEGESNVPTYFSSVLLAVCAGLLGLIWSAKNFVKQDKPLPWLLLSVGFVGLSLDEIARFHELSGELAQAAAGSSDPLVMVGMLPRIAVVVIAALYFFPFLLRLPRRTKILFSISAFIYVGAVVGVEIVDSYYFFSVGVQNLTYGIFSWFEESSEIAGLLIFIFALLDYIENNMEGIAFRIGGRANKPPTL